MKDIGRRLREAREAAGISQEEAGAFVGKGRDRVRAWEAGKTIPADYVAAVARKTGASPSWLLLGEEAGEDAAKLRFMRLVLDGKIPPVLPPSASSGE